MNKTSRKKYSPLFYGGQIVRASERISSMSPKLVGPSATTPDNIQAWMAFVISSRDC